MNSRIYLLQRSDTGAVGVKDGSWRENASDEDLILESWSQGFVSFPCEYPNVGFRIAFLPFRGLTVRLLGMFCGGVEIDISDLNCRASVFASSPKRTYTANISNFQMVGALIIMACITVANMRRGVLLHKLILVEVRSCPKSTKALLSSKLTCPLSNLQHYRMVRLGTIN